MKIRQAAPGDEAVLAYIQTQSWKAAFSDILSAADLEEYTNEDNVRQMYQHVLQSGMCRVALSFIGDTPHGMAAWGNNRCDFADDVAELICIHSLQNGWGKGYGSELMRYVLDELRKAQYRSVILWVFEANTRARRFYEAHGFRQTEQSKPFCGMTEVMYERVL